MTHSSFDMTPKQAKAYDLWSSFENTVLYSKRYFVTHPLLDTLKGYLKHNVKIIAEGDVYFRARIIDESARKDYMMVICEKEDGNYKRYVSKANKFKGLSKEASYVPPNNRMIREGRANPKFIKYLYVAENPTTAIFEVRPLLSDRINLSEIQLKRDLTIADLTYNFDAESKNMSEQEWLLFYIHRAFSTPTNNPDAYIPSQIIAASIEAWGYDGIRYNSSLHHGGVNLTIFNPNNCEPISSREMIMEGFKISARTAGQNPIDNKLLGIMDNECHLIDTRDFNDTVLPVSKNERKNTCKVIAEKPSKD